MLFLLLLALLQRLVTTAHEQCAMDVDAGWKLDICHFQQGLRCDIVGHLSAKIITEFCENSRSPVDSSMILACWGPVGRGEDGGVSAITITAVSTLQTSARILNFSQEMYNIHTFYWKLCHILDSFTFILTVAERFRKVVVVVVV